MSCSIDLSKQAMITNGFSEKYYESINGNVFTNRSSTMVFDQYFENVFEAPDTLYVLSGSDSALLFSYLINRFSGKTDGRQFLVVDFEEIQDVNDKTLPGWIQACTINDFLKKMEESFQVYVFTGKVELVKSLAVHEAKMHENYYQHHEVLVDLFKALEVKQRKSMEVKNFMNHATLNAYRNQFSISTISNSLKGRPFLVIGAGPSLDDHLSWIKENQDHFIIVIVSRVSKVLLQSGIKPDFVVSVDPTYFSYENSREALLLENPAVLINTSYAASNLLSAWPQESVYFNNAFPWIPDELMVKEAEPTVTHIGIQAAYLLGASEVYLVGVDFCFKDGQTHESSSMEVDIGKHGFEHIMQVKTYSGELAETELMFNSGIEFLKKQVESYTNCSFYNLNLHAAVVPGVDYIDSQSIVIKSQEKITDLSKVRSKISPTKDQKVMLFKGQIKKVQDFRALLTNIKKLSSEMVREIKRTSEPNVKITRINKKLKRLIPDKEKNFLFFYGQAELGMLTVKDTPHAPKLSEVDIIKTYSTGMVNVTTEFLAYLDASLKLLQLRLKELDDRTPLGELAKSWGHLDETGRHRVWVKQHGIALTKDETLLFEELDCKFLSEFTQNSDHYKIHLESVRTSLPLMEERLFKAFKAKDEYGLKQFVEELDDINSDDFQIINMASLAKGRLAQIRGNFMDAIKLYNQVESESLREIALKSLLVIEVNRNNHEAITVCFTKLIECSPKYMISYAEYLTRVGQSEIAWKVFELYFSHASDDFQSWLKYLEALIKQEETEKSKILLSKIEQMFGNKPELSKYKNKV